MRIRRIGLFALPFAAAGLLGFAATSSAAGSSALASLDDGQVHGFTGCLAQEPTGIHYFDLTKAKSDTGKDLGTVRLTSSVWGITPKGAVAHEVHVNGMYRGHLSNDPQGGHIAVKDAAVVANTCS